MSELLVLREAEGGELPAEVESSFVERLDDLWWKLSEEEQQVYEAELADDSVPSTPEALGLVDCEVDEGDHAGPRKAA
jgi:hypothetical protein